MSVVPLTHLVFSMDMDMLSPQAPATHLSQAEPDTRTMFVALLMRRVFSMVMDMLSLLASLVRLCLLMLDRSSLLAFK